MENIDLQDNGLSEKNVDLQSEICFEGENRLIINLGN